MTDPTHCDRCKATLSGGWSERWRGRKRVEAVCNACDNAEHVAEYLRTRRLSSKVMVLHGIDSVIREDGHRAPILPTAAFAMLDADAALISAAVRRFERMVWFGGMAQAVRASRSSHMVGRGEGYEIRCLSSAGRWMATIEGKAGESVTVITEEGSDESRMGLQGIDATSEQAAVLLAAVERDAPVLRDVRGSGFLVDAPEGA